MNRRGVGMARVSMRCGPALVATCMHQAGDVLDIVVDLRDDYGNAAGGSSLPVTVHAKLPDNTTVASFSISAPATTAEFQVRIAAPSTVALIDQRVPAGRNTLSGHLCNLAYSDCYWA